MRKPPVLMSMLSRSDRWRADRRARMERGRDRNNGGVVVLRRLVKAQFRQRQTPLEPGKPLQVWPKQLRVTPLFPPNECVCVCVRVWSNQTSQTTLVFTSTTACPSVG